MHTQQQLSILFETDADWTPAMGRTTALLHACAANQRGNSDGRCFVGDGPRDGVLGIHAAGCQYSRSTPEAA